ncbi:MAG: 30S ribosomal protein S2 [Deltaproteobacteria bacterium]
MGAISMKHLLEAGVHFGHQTNKWNPKMKPYIFGARNGIYIIDLQQTTVLFQVAYDFILKTVSEGGDILFIGTKKQSQEATREEALRCGMPYVNERWLGGMLTNFSTVKKSIDRLNYLDSIFADESVKAFTKKEMLKLQKERDKGLKVLGGIRDLNGLPKAVFVIDPKRETIAIAEARKLRIPVVAVVDTNCDPDVIDYIIPGNDDAIRAIKLFSSKIADAVMEGKGNWQEDTDILVPNDDTNQKTGVIEEDVPESVETKEAE